MHVLSQRFFARKVSIFILSGLRLVLRGDTIFSEVLKSRSEAALVAQTQRYICTIFDSRGSYMTAFSTIEVDPLLNLAWVCQCTHPTRYVSIALEI